LDVNILETSHKAADLSLLFLWSLFVKTSEQTNFMVSLNQSWLTTVK